MIIRVFFTPPVASRLGVIKGMDAQALKAQMLALLDTRGAKYPAEHNVGHLYKAEVSLQKFYRKLDPTNRFNPGLVKWINTNAIVLVVH